MVPELALSAEAAQLDHRQHEVEPEALGIERDGAIELEARLVLRRGRRDQPAVAADGNEDADFHGRRRAIPGPLLKARSVGTAVRSTLDQQHYRRGDIVAKKRMACFLRIIFATHRVIGVERGDR